MVGRTASDHRIAGRQGGGMGEIRKAKEHTGR
jgi:hypothetical protein